MTRLRSREDDYIQATMLHTDFVAKSENKMGIECPHRVLYPLMENGATTGLIPKGASIEPLMMLCSVEVIGAKKPSNYFRQQFCPPQFEISDVFPGAIQLGPQHWVAEARQLLEEIGQLHDNWDGEGALGVSPSTIETATLVLEAMIGHGTRLSSALDPAILPLPDGSVRYELVDGDRELFLTIKERQIEAQRWEPLTAMESSYYEEIGVDQVLPELEWLTA